MIMLINIKRLREFNKKQHIELQNLKAQRMLVTKLLKAANMISENKRKGTGNIVKPYDH